MEVNEVREIMQARMEWPTGLHCYILPACSEFVKYTNNRN